jgi:peptidyl-prolyl cis-trans isomerase SurA
MVNCSFPFVTGSRRPAVLGVLLAGSLAACQSAPAPEPAISPDTWAVVDGRQITRPEVEKAYRRTEQGSQPASAEEALAAKLALLDELIVQDLLLAKAAALKIELPASELDAAYAKARENITDEAFQQELARRQLSAEDMRDGLRRQLLAQKVIEREVGSKVVVSDQEVSDFFNANRAQFNLAEDAYRIAQIVVTPGRDPQLANRTGDDAATPQAVQAKAKMLMERLQGGARFSELAMDYSEDPETAPRGGDLGFVPVSRLAQVPPPLRNAVLQGSPGSVKLVPGGGGFTLVLVVAHEKAGQRELTSQGVRENIMTTLRGRREQLLRAAYLTDLRGRATVVNHLARRLVESEGKVPNLGLTPPAGQ